MTQEIIKLNGYSLHIDYCLIGASLTSSYFRYALQAASVERLRRIIADLELHLNRKDRIGKLQSRLARLEKINAKLAPAAAEQHPVQAIASGLAMAAIGQARSEGHTITIPSLGISIPPVDLAETLEDIDGQISSAEDEIYRLRAWRAEVVAQMDSTGSPQVEQESTV